MAASIAGCQGDQQQAGEQSPEAAAERYYDAADASETESILHPDSPLDPDAVFEQRAGDTAVAFVEASTLRADTDATGLSQAQYWADQIDPEELDALAQEEALTLLSAVVKINGEPFAFPLLTATADADWYVLTTVTGRPVD